MQVSIDSQLIKDKAQNDFSLLFNVGASKTKLYYKVVFPDLTQLAHPRLKTRANCTK